eukprot:644990-Karenia_brevis.AAC.1
MLTPLTMAAEDSEYFDSWHSLTEGDKERYRVRWEAASAEREPLTINAKVSALFSWFQFCQDQGSSKPFRPPPRLLAEYLDL